jgi:MSHA biogenesis protein MshQ
MKSCLRSLAVMLLFMLAGSPAHAAITVGNATTYDSGGPSTSTVTLATPAGIVAGDLLVAQITVRGGSNATVTAQQSGWTEVLNRTSGTNLRQVVFHRFVAGGEPASFTWSVSPGQRAAAGLSSFRGVDSVAPVNASGSQSNGSSGTITAPPVTTNASDTLILGLFGIATSATLTPQSGQTQLLSADASAAGPNGAAILQAYVLQPNAQASGNKTASSPSSAVNIGALLALKPLALLRADYHFDECTYGGTAGEVRDSFGAFHATSRNATTTSAPGQVERFANLDRHDRWIETSIPLTRDWSISTWFRTPFAAAGNSPFNIIAAISGGSDLLYLDRSQNYRWGVYTTPPQTSTDANFRFGTLASGWHHMALVGQGSRTLLYIDGTLVDQVNSKAGGTLRYIGTSFDSVNTADAQGFRAPLDEFMVWDHALNTAQISGIFANQAAARNYDGTARAAAACGPHHLRILHDGSALTCTPETVTIQACADASCSSLHTGSVTTTLAPTGWIGGDTISFSGGSTTAQLRRTTAGSVTLGAASTTPAPTSATRCFNGATETCTLAFANSGFIFEVPDLTACKPSGPVTISAVRTDDVTQRCVPAFASVTRSVSFWSAYANPNTGAQAVSVNGTPVVGAAPGTALNLAFDANARATITVAYPDAGQMQLNARHTGSGAEAGLILNGTDSFVSVPVGLAVYSDDPNAACTPASAGCSVLARAGDAFPLKVKAACWQSDADANLADNPATPNFRMTGIPLASTLIAPAGGANAALGTASFDFVAADAGIHSISQTVSEVGVFQFSATPGAGAYFGASVPGGTSANIGRFIPHRFAPAAGAALTNRSDVPACVSAFTYLSEPLRLNFTLRAENASGGLTANYIGAFAKLGLTSAASFDFGALNGANNLTARLDLSTPPTGTWSGGQAAVSATLGIARAANPDGPYTQVDLGIAPRDADNVALLPAALDLDIDGAGGNDHRKLVRTEVRFGRVRLENAFGSELLDLPLPARVQHWNGVGFVDSADDACTRFSAGDFTLVFPASPKNLLAACETTVSLAGGLPAALRLTKPGAGNQGWADIRLNLGAASGQTCVGAAATPATTASKAYLQGRWSGAGWNQDPSARATFGLYRGADPFIYQRENH